MVLEKVAGDPQNNGGHFALNNYVRSLYRARQKYRSGLSNGKSAGHHVTSALPMINFNVHFDSDEMLSLHSISASHCNAPVGRSF